jgi:hypothetical protein
MKKSIKIFVLLGIAGFLVTGALVIWAGVAAVNFALSNVNFDAQGKLKTFQASNCWVKAETLLAVEPWLERPALLNLQNLKVACFEQTPEGKVI